MTIVTASVASGALHVPEKKVEENIKNRPVTEAVTLLSYRIHCQCANHLLKIARKVSMV